MASTSTARADAECTRASGRYGRSMAESCRAAGEASPMRTFEVVSEPIGRPPDAVFAYLADPLHFAEFQVDTTVEPKDPGDPGPGKRYRKRRRTPLGMQTINFEMTRLDPAGRRVEYRVIDGPI